MCTETHKLACDKLQGFLSCKCLVIETEVTLTSHLATTVDSEENALGGEPLVPGCSRGWWEKVMEYTGFITQGLSLWGTDAFLFTVHFPLYHLCLENRDIQGCLKLLIFKLFIIGHFSQGTAAKAFFQKDEISSAVTMGKLLVAELRQGWRKVKAVRVNPRWDASLHLHATS